MGGRGQKTSKVLIPIYIFHEKSFSCQARKLADKHEKEAKDIKSTTDMALNQSTIAYNTSKMARDMEEKINKDLKEKSSNVDEAMKLANESRKLIQESKNESNAAIVDGKKLIDEAMEDLSDLKAKEMKG